ncbi:hypothetical protein A2348_00435 [Candidatus Uhrbacteria bacterium RIFOXYB12_FULL_58_10]|uniref:DUF2304 domain-containing protein n=1 Tax=Candidatus Uhrbacteria bacterium RIFOXYB2_FULL_57_15 TaxID=1802422 RepID=A0A1F7W842_9BACT|nr:MAG: hypothetical protein A2348_00435 [Candidatus Uhrbacteria bacterium RIFOXYB12_FULL_58_10]OGL98377.1 MAG: hypothetical protein A2304_01625 [Candidatus Uhrbacteria bacterium RIFOXYB2_FULL_57_15]OGM00169.1 MAG: hypothetical protein A2501_01330 [Candidatus Uhrbacteria bacterium RIFOXYC12_FULL_57_11]
MTFQVILVLFALFAITRTSRQYRKRKVSLYWFLLWTGLWALVIGIALYPTTADAIARFVGVERGADLALYLAVVLLAYLVFRLFVRQEETERSITQVVRQIAVQHPSKPDETH